MNWKNLTLLTAIAVALIVAPAANAQRSERRGGGGARNFAMQPGISSGARTRFEGHRGGGRDRWRNDRNRWGNHRHRNWHHRRYYPRYYSGFYGSRFGFGYPYGYGYPYYGYGYGYPYYGSSVSLHFSGHFPQSGYNTAARGGSVVVEVQQELARAGYYRGAIDGVIGNSTRSAIRAYERANGLRVDGRIDQELLGSMGIG